MADIEKALATQIQNIEARTGNTLAGLIEVIHNSGLVKHGEIIAMLKREFELGHGDANTLAHLAKNANKAPQTAASNPLDALYSEKKAPLRSIHEALLQRMQAFGEFDTAPKQKYVSYRRNRQFAMIGPATNTRVEVGLNIKALPEAERLEQLPAGKMCNFVIKLTDKSQVDDELVGWIKAAYDAAG